MPDQHASTQPGSGSISGSGSGPAHGDLFAALEAQLVQLRAVQSDHEARTMALTRREADLAAMEARLGERQQSLDAAAEQLEARRAAVEADLQAGEEALAEESARLDRQRRALAEERDAIDEARETLEVQRDDLAREAARLTALAESLEARAAALDETQDHLARAQEAIAGRETVLAELASAQAAARQAQEDLEQRLQQARRSAHEAQARVEALTADADALRAETAALRTAQAAAADLERRCADLENERESLLAQVSDLEQRLEDASTASSKAPSAAQVAELSDERALLLARVVHLETQLTACAQQVQSPDADDHAEALRALECRLAELDGECSRLRDERALADQLRDEAERGVQALEARCRELERAAADAEAQAKTKPVDRPAAAAGAADQEFREKAKRLAAIARHLKGRQLRLRRYRAAIELRRGEPVQREIRGVDMEKHAAQIRHLEQQKHELADLRRKMSIAERRMIRRWARPRAVATLGWLMLCALVAAGGSWIAASRLYPPMVTASLVLEPKGAKAAISDDEAIAWRSWHLGLLHDNTFRMSLAKRMADLRLDKWDDEISVGRVLTQDLTHDSIDPRRITLTLAGTSERETLAFLDVLGGAISFESQRQHKRRGEGVWASIAGERREGERIRYATAGEVPIRDERFAKAGPMFGGSLLVLVLLGIGISTHLARVKREFDADGSLFNDEPIAQSA